MNTKTLKGMTAAASLLIGIGAASPALATTTGQQALGVVLANGIDVWTFTCGPAALGAVARVLDNGPNNAAAAVQVVLGHDGNPTAQATDTEGGAASGFAAVSDGPVGYTMAFKKTGGGAEGYTGEAFCTNGAVLAPVGGLTRRINQ